jgi:hypothetical protein
VAFFGSGEDMPFNAINQIRKNPKLYHPGHAIDYLWLTSLECQTLTAVGVEAYSVQQSDEKICISAASFNTGENLSGGEIINCTVPISGWGAALFRAEVMVAAFAEYVEYHARGRAFTIDENARVVEVASSKSGFGFDIETRDNVEILFFSKRVRTLVGYSE